MRTIKDPNLAQLLMQLRYTPQDKQRSELEAAEKLYALIDDTRQYPFDFVCFHITGFHPQGDVDHRLIEGKDLRQDLELFIARLSSKLVTAVNEQGEKVYSAEELAQRFNVSTKTISRWRRRGLLARKFVFPDGGHRFGFLESTVERFVRNHPTLVAQAGRFRRLTTNERQQVVRQARSLAAKTSLSRHQIIQEICRKLGIAHETARYTLQEYERQHPDHPVFRRPSGRMKPTDAAELYRLHKQGIGVRQLMARFDRSRASIYRIVNQRRAMTLLARKIDFVPSEEFLRDDARQRILGAPLRIDKPEPGTRVEPFEMVGESLLPEYLQILTTTPVLSRDEEIDLFRRYNFLKYLVATERHQIRLASVSATLLTRLEGYLEQAENIRRVLIEANLRLVVSIASKHTGDGANFSELVSKGNFALIQAVEEYDYTKGFRFGRRASLHIAKEYAKVSGRSTELTRRRAESLATIRRGLQETAADVLAIERARQSLAEVIREELDEREQYVILHHFGLVGTSVRKTTKTLKQIGDELGLTKERIRQIELTALQKLRQCLSKKQFELLTG
ncbi:MAG TPA: sigma-70 family RNA polymerase sigma factor [Sedimentisphaerales bacterium]|nr:sigma-70 family RNA polymerase sigma factor [Sedimentisphaerales bacterium]HRS12653.1 sigma-70 family RNA polymerase sigma factor [Sedimentisphaerales bacterium]HRV49734.1 sigma-70 family RNA polymerase sigma factor [Sedimentisphaerales bacterium]